MGNGLKAQKPYDRQNLLQLTERQKKNAEGQLFNKFLSQNAGIGLEKMCNKRDIQF